MGENPPLNEKFLSFQKQFNDEQKLIEDICTICGEIDLLSRHLLTSLHIIHYENPNFPREIRDLRILLVKTKAAYAKLQEIVPRNDYYKYHYLWKYPTRNHCTHVALTIWLETRNLASPEQVAEVLGINAEEKQGFHLDLNDYLLGVVDLCTEFARVAETSEIYKRYTWPLLIYKIVIEVDAGLRMLRVKHDPLKKEFGLLRHSIRAIEEIVNHIFMCGFLKPILEQHREGLFEKKL